MAAFRVRLSTSMMLPSRLLLLAVLALPSTVSAQQPAYIDDRLNQLQQSLTLLTGQLEQLQYSNQQLHQQMEKMQADYEYRLDALEKGKGGGSGAPPRPSPTPIQTPQQNLAAPGQI